MVAKHAESTRNVSIRLLLPRFALGNTVLWILSVFHSGVRAVHINLLNFASKWFAIASEWKMTFYDHKHAKYALHITVRTPNTSRTIKCSISIIKSMHQTRLGSHLCTIQASSYEQQLQHTTNTHTQANEYARRESNSFEQCSDFQGIFMQVHT